MTYYLVNLRTGKIVEKFKGDFIEFLKNEWGGLYPYKFPGEPFLRSSWGSMHGCERYDMYWTGERPKKGEIKGILWF